MKHFCDDWIQEWCENNGWSDWFLEHRNYWAFPPHGVLPLPIPKESLMELKARKGYSLQEKIWLGTIIIVTLMGILSSYFTNSPMPLVFAFAITAIIVADLELD
jgi:hypothetical protein